MKKIVFSLIFAFIFLIGAGDVRAYEGSVDMSSSSVSCKATSVWKENQYRLIGKCDGLVYPYETQYEHYYVWAHEVERDSFVRISEIDRGYFEGNIDNSFDRLIVTAEADNNPRKPSDKEIVSGDVTRFSFDKSEVKEEVTEKPVTRVVQSDSAEVVTSNSTSTVGSVLGRIVTALLAIVLIVIAIVVVGSLVFRRRGSVSS